MHLAAQKRPADRVNSEYNNLKKVDFSLRGNRTTHLYCTIFPFFECYDCLMANPAYVQGVSEPQLFVDHAPSRIIKY